LAPRQAASPDGTSCPACTKVLTATKVGDLEVRECPACGGLWLDRVVFEQLGTSRERQGAVLGALPSPTAPPVVSLEAVQYRPCPACQQRMNRVNYASVPASCWMSAKNTASGSTRTSCAGPGLHFRRRSRPNPGAGDRGLKEAKRAAVQIPVQPASSYEFTQQMHPGPHWLGAAGLAWLASEVAGHFWNKIDHPACFTSSANFLGSRLAPPTRPPATSGMVSSSGKLSGVTLPP